MKWTRELASGLASKIPGSLHYSEVWSRNEPTKSDIAIFTSSGNIKDTEEVLKQLGAYSGIGEYVARLGSSLIVEWKASDTRLFTDLEKTEENLEAIKEIADRYFTEYTRNVQEEVLEDIQETDEDASS